MEEAGISPQTKSCLALLSRQSWLGQFYLAGGTACALNFGHRISVDLDFFARQPFQPEIIINHLSDLGHLVVDTKTDDTILGTFNQVKVSFFLYQYSEIAPFDHYMGVKLASVPDLVAMKIDALQSRGTRRDFIDLYLLLTQNAWSLADGLEFFQKKFAAIDYNREHILMSLVYFDNADQSAEQLRLNRPLEWATVKNWFVTETKKIKQDILK